MKKIKITLLISSFLLGVPFTSEGAELQYQFSSPSFNGSGYGSYVLTLKQLEDQQREKNTAAADALKSAAENAAANTPQAQFVTNLQSRIYAQLSKQITDSLFGSSGGLSCTSAGGVTTCPTGTLDVGGNTITWSLSSDNKNIVISVVNNIDPSQYTNMTVPVGSFGF
jgi:hypothetical protein